jgi:hypothetical protein
MTIFKEIKSQPFIFATGLAALVHSTWTLGTLFTGPEPRQMTLNWLLWLTPAFLIAFALDVGQIVTSAEIRSNRRTRAKYATFFVFAAATYFCQWNYIAAHVPALPLAPGVRAQWLPFATLLRDSSLWILPALLPLSTLLYTFSSSQPASPLAQESAAAHRVPGAAALSDTVAIVETDTRWGQESAANIAATPVRRPPTDNGR